jgi:hypothetical protein
VELFVGDEDGVIKDSFFFFLDGVGLQPIASSSKA